MAEPKRTVKEVEEVVVTASRGEYDKLLIFFTHIPSKYIVSFLSFTESFNDSYDSEWSSEKVFNKMDPLVQYKGTSRKISMSFTVPSKNSVEAYVNHVKISKLLNMMYPSYESKKSTTLDVYDIKGPPLFGVSFNNLIKSKNSDGLLGYIPSLKYEPDLNSNIFRFAYDNTFLLNNFPQENKSYLPDEARSSQAQFQKYFQKQENRSLIGFQSFKISFELNVLHSHNVGHVGDRKGLSTFPYGF